ncbi:hypothetical protein Ae201684P_002613 [Aphanomyces euteiches]|uniref:Uncharacterized protein n=1 Tax=Aphanomyces euteiches TaxID=100861 RepID=A0A6G0X253_9STRA|nr:hypothetical protein Ae201684_009458 [Aphanomyces euteiches]KAH9050843.1 hypothetical protein Ae201684P_020711 [Aphanomyces euteiches]KAH9070247.1 hypothetical protein Ae201684P_002613 [Aphanomyces euteiches]
MLQYRAEHCDGIMAAHCNECSLNANRVYWPYEAQRFCYFVQRHSHLEGQSHGCDSVNDLRHLKCVNFIAPKRQGTYASKDAFCGLRRMLATAFSRCFMNTGEKLWMKSPPRGGDLS